MEDLWSAGIPDDDGSTLIGSMSTDFCNAEFVETFPTCERRPWVGVTLLSLQSINVSHL